MGVKEKIDKIVELLQKAGAHKIVLFGSRAKGYATAHSDIDIAVDLELDFRSQRKLKEMVEECSGLYSVDLVFLPDVSNSFAEQIAKEGKVLYEKE